jgi:hypothetical protein
MHLVGLVSRNIYLELFTGKFDQPSVLCRNQHLPSAHHVFREEIACLELMGRICHCKVFIRRTPP